MSIDGSQVNNDHRSALKSGKQNTKQQQGKKVLLISDSIIKEIEKKLSSTKLVKKKYACLEPNLKKLKIDYNLL